MGPGQQRYVNTAPLPSGIRMDRYIETIQQNILQEIWKQVQYCLIFCFILVSTICKVSNIYQLSNFVYEEGTEVVALLIKISTLSTYLQCHIVFVAKKSAVSARAPDPSARAAVWECEHLVLQSAARHPAAARLKKLSQHLRRRRSQSVRSVVRAEPEHTRHSGAGIEGRSLVRGTLTFVPPSSCGARAPATSDTRDILASSQSRSETGQSPTSVAGFDTKRGENLPYEKSSYMQWVWFIKRRAVQREYLQKMELSVSRWVENSWYWCRSI